MRKTSLPLKNRIYLALRENRSTVIASSESFSWAPAASLVGNRHGVLCCRLGSWLNVVKSAHGPGFAAWSY